MYSKVMRVNEQYRIYGIDDESLQINVRVSYNVVESENITGNVNRALYINADCVLIHLRCENQPDEHQAVSRLLVKLAPYTD
jgi:DNA polymerase elongation subunit (family B)